MQYNMMQYYTAWYNTIRYDMLWPCAISASIRNTTSKYHRSNELSTLQLFFCRSCNCLFSEYPHNKNSEPSANRICFIFQPAANTNRVVIEQNYENDCQTIYKWLKQFDLNHLFDYPNLIDSTISHETKLVLWQILKQNLKFLRQVNCLLKIATALCSECEIYSIFI